MLRGSDQFNHANRLLGKMANRVLTKLQLQYEDIKDKPHYYPTSCSMYIPPSMGEPMEASSVEFSIGRWDKTRYGKEYRLFAGESYIKMNFAIPKTAEEFIALEAKIVETAEAFLK